MRRFSLLLLIAIVLLINNYSDRAFSQTDEKEAEKKFVKELSLISEIWNKKVTLEFISDKKSSELLANVLNDFDAEMKENFLNNIVGPAKKVILQNYKDKMNELVSFSSQYAVKNPKSDGVLLKVCSAAGLPGKLAFAPVVKKVLQGRQFQLVQASSEQKAALEERVKLFQKAVEELTEVAKIDLFPVLQKHYASISPKEFPIHWYDSANYEITYTTTGKTPKPPATQKKKDWTILFYINADNDLERYGLQDINEIEMVGSTDRVNLVVQLDRMKAGDGNSISDGNWTGTRRYYVTKDVNPRKIGSKMVMNVGTVDMGSSGALGDFLSWGVKTYPAERTAVVVWNHGMGWGGVSFDDESGKYLRMPDLTKALSIGQKALSDVLGKPGKFAMLDFDACLMGTIEVAYELSDFVEFMVASQENAPGSGMPYAHYLEPLAKNPAMETSEFTKRLVGTYVSSYSKGGSATNRYVEGASVTKSALDLSKIQPLVKLVNQLGSQMSGKHDIYTKLLSGRQKFSALVRKYSDETLVDLSDFCESLASLKDLPEEIRTTSRQIVQTLGYPVTKDRLSDKIRIVSNQPGFVVWGYNDWRMPPEELRPSGTKVFQSRLALTKLRQIDDKQWGLEIGPFEMVVDKVLEKKVFVNEINYQIIDGQGKVTPKRTVRQNKEYLVVSKFPPESPLIIEGHTQGMGNSRGLSIYYPPAYKFKTNYKATKFARDTSWDEFISKIPVFRKEAPVLLTGQLADDPITWMSIAMSLKENKVDFQTLWDPSLFGYDFKAILAQFSNGMVIADSVSASSMGNLSPSSQDLSEYLENGGSLFIAAQSLEQQNIHARFLENYLRFNYVEDEINLEKLQFITRKDEKIEFLLNGVDSSESAEDVTVMKPELPAKPVVKFEDGRAGGLCIHSTSGIKKSYSAVFFGFRFEAITDQEIRTKIMGDILERLYPEKNQLSLF
ncbi:MAG: hypothetical protein HQM10_19150 [Candidatus Riflebacteria bacterium]|nr:hypothetical protein [Candidatus Riflebacteria bacterium]